MSRAEIFATSHFLNPGKCRLTERPSQRKTYADYEGELYRPGSVPLSAGFPMYDLRPASPMKSISTFRSALLAALLTAAIGAWFGFNRSEPTLPLQPESTSASTSPSALPAVDALEVDNVVPDESSAGGAAVPSGKVLFAKPLHVSGQPLDLKGPAYLRAWTKGEHIVGRVAELDRESFAAIRNVAEGDAVSIPTFDGSLAGIVEVVDTEDEGWQRIGGPLRDGRDGWFTLSFNGQEAAGLVRLTSQRLAYDIRPAAGGALQMVERPVE
jgi:hypothetical protein